MKIKVKIKKGSRNVEKEIEVKAYNIFDLLNVESTQEIYKKLFLEFKGDIGGYIVSIEDEEK